MFKTLARTNTHCIHMQKFTFYTQKDPNDDSKETVFKTATRERERRERERERERER